MDAALRDYARVEQAIAFLAERSRDQPSLDETARQIGLSPAHFQRLFQRWAGVSPKRFLQALSLEEAKRRLQAGEPVLPTSLDLGFSGPSRLHDLLVTFEAVSPGELARGGADLEIRWGVTASPFGRCHVAITPRGLTKLAFDVDDGTFCGDLGRAFSRATLVRDDAGVKPWIARIFRTPRGEELRLIVRGTAFQLQVWRALLAIPEGRVTSYQAIARAIGRPTSTRAVGNAVGANPIAWLIPCHRVLREMGALGGYRWGLPRKRAMLAWEATRS